MNMTGGTSACITWPNYQPNQHQPNYTVNYIPSSPTYPIQIRKVTNGFVLIHSGSEFVFPCMESLIDRLADMLMELK